MKKVQVKVPLLHGTGQSYQVYCDREISQLKFGELLVEIHAIGLNSIDWKSAAFGFVIHQLPSLNGPLFVAVPPDYRGSRKPAFQEFATVCCYNATCIPRHIDPFPIASIGVAYVAASLALGVCHGISFTKGDDKRPFNLLNISKTSPEDIPSDIVEEIFHGIRPSSQPYPSEWVLIYGGSIVRFEGRSLVPS
ncbi:hypothetical protein EDB80DRAFT_753778 [Ilyonectria destructans]|nr:hypothetical protein EDB80DRAFT_753778 [Ilyonectria destructans]